MSGGAADELFLAPASTGGRLVYAVGDVHGRYDRLAELLALIARDSDARAPAAAPVLVFLGDYVDRGPDSARVLSTLVWLRRHGGFEVHALMGNHERAMLDFLADPVATKVWMRWGGDATLASYGVAAPGEDAPDADFARARDDLLDQLPVAHLRLLEALAPIATIGDYAFVHAGIRPGVPLRRQEEADLLWIREEFLDDEQRHEKVIVHGHTWVDAEPVLRPNRIGVDTGAYSTGVLTAVRLEDGAVDVLRAGGPG